MGATASAPAAAAPRSLADAVSAAQHRYRDTDACLVAQRRGRGEPLPSDGTPNNVLGSYR